MITLGVHYDDNCGHESYGMYFIPEDEWGGIDMCLVDYDEIECDEKEYNNCLYHRFKM